MFRVVFDSLSMMFIFYEIINLPLTISFSDKLVISPFQNLLNDYIIIHFSLDIILNFNTAFYFKGKLQTNKKQTIKNYL